MRGTRTPEGQPLRPLTVGELLDAAVSLLRTHAVPLLALAVPLAALEQLLLMPLREAFRLAPPFYFPDLMDDDAGLGGWWLVVTVGFGTEAAIIALLGGLAAAAAGPALLGVDVRGKALWRAARLPSAAVVAVVAAIVCSLSVIFGFVGWVFLYGLLGLAVPALVVDRSSNPFSALGRSFVLASRGGLRAVWIRVAAYLSWFAIRFALGAGWTSALDQIGLSPPAWLVWASAVAWIFADVLAYAALGCLDAVLHLETRIRTEGLDLDIGRARRHGVAPVLELRRAGR